MVPGPPRLAPMAELMFQSRGRPFAEVEDSLRILAAEGLRLARDQFVEVARGGDRDTPARLGVFHRTGRLRTGTATGAQARGEQEHAETGGQHQPEAAGAPEAFPQLSPER